MHINVFAAVPRPKVGGGGEGLSCPKKLQVSFLTTQKKAVISVLDIAGNGTVH